VNLLEAVPSRQRTEPARITLPLSGLLGAAGAVQSRAVRAAGYNSVVGLVVSDVPGTVTIMAAPETRRGGRRAPGTFVPIATIPTVALGGVQAAQIDEEVRGDYIRVDYVNGAAAQTVFQFSAYLVPVFCFKRVEVVNGDIDVTAAPIGTPRVSSTSQSLAVGALSLTSAVALAKKPRWVSISFDAVLPGAQTVTITLDSALGAAFDVVVESVMIPPAATPAAQGYLFEFPPEFLLAAGDQINVALTNTGAPAVTASAVIMQESS
jgi:hypothetical protein